MGLLIWRLAEQAGVAKVVWYTGWPQVRVRWGEGEQVDEARISKSRKPAGFPLLAGYALHCVPRGVRTTTHAAA